MLVIVIPVLKRPHRVQPLIESIERATPEEHRTLFVCTEGDHAEQEAVKAAGAELIVLPGERRPGDFARKTNFAYRSTWEPLLFLGADDIKPHDGWLSKALARLGGPVGVVGTNDLTNRRTKRFHSTHSLVTRDYVDMHGTIDEAHKVLHEGYSHNFVDDELVATANHRAAYAHAHDCYVEHLHPMRQKSVPDPIYSLGQAQFDVDRRLFQSREPLWT